MAYCSNVFEHSQFLWPIDRDGTPTCPFDAPLRREGSDLYWSFPVEGGMVSFDDFERIATEYPVIDVDEDGEPRAYTEEENARADAAASQASLAQAQADFDRAVGLNAAPEQLAVLQAANHAAAGIEPGDPWRQPTGAHDAYPLDALVSHNGKNWRSTIAANVWEPGVSGWVEDGEGIPDWVQPTGAHDAYALGAIVRHNGLVWQSTVDANVWEPPTLWTEIPDPEA